MKIQHGGKNNILGPGGINCSCCRVGSKSFTKKYINKVFRRTFNIESEIKLYEKTNYNFS